MTPTSDSSSVIEIKASYFVLAFLLALFKPMASINGTAPFQVRWGTTPIPVPPGRYQVEVWLPYLFLSTMGKNGIVIDVPAGGAVQVWWKAPWLVFLQGKIAAGPASGSLPAGTGPGALGSGSAGDGQAQAYGAGSPGGAAPTSAPQPGAWHPDPSGRHEQRYYDGTAWTEHVVDAGVTSSDPVGG